MCRHLPAERQEPVDLDSRQGQGTKLQSEVQRNAYHRPQMVLRNADLSRNMALFQTGQAGGQSQCHSGDSCHYNDSDHSSGEERRWQLHDPREDPEPVYQVRSWTGVQSERVYHSRRLHDRGDSQVRRIYMGTVEIRSRMDLSGIC